MLPTMAMTWARMVTTTRNGAKAQGSRWSWPMQQVGVEREVQKALGGADVPGRPAADRTARRQRTRPEQPAPPALRCPSTWTTVAPAAAQHRDLVALPRHRQAYDQADKRQQQPDDGDAKGEEQDVKTARRLLIVGRGGGSLEDLWAFNEEIVARAIFNSELPVISAVGHEIDFSIADFVADLRAPTPSAAAEIAVPNIIELAGRLGELTRSLTDEVSYFIKDGNRRLTELKSRYGLKRPLEIIAQRSQRCDELSRLLNLNMTHQIKSISQNSHSIFEKLEIVSPLSILKRGYAYCRDSNGKVIKSFRQVAIDDKLDIVLFEGGVESRITRIKPDISKKIGDSKNYV